MLKKLKIFLPKIGHIMHACSWYFSPSNNTGEFASKLKSEIFFLIQSVILLSYALTLVVFTFPKIQQQK